MVNVKLNNKQMKKIVLLTITILALSVSQLIAQDEVRLDNNLLNSFADEIHKAIDGDHLSYGETGKKLHITHAKNDSRLQQMVIRPHSSFTPQITKNLLTSYLGQQMWRGRDVLILDSDPNDAWGRAGNMRYIDGAVPQYTNSIPFQLSIDMSTGAVYIMDLRNL